MANPDSEGSFHEVLTELERLVEIGKNLRNSYMNFESITDLITQKLVGLRALDDDDIRGTSLKNLNRLLGLRNTILELNISSNRNYGEHWEILDGLLERMITMLSFLHPVDATSDLRCLETLEGWVVLNDKMIRHPNVSPESGSLLNDIVFTRLNTLLETFENGLIVKDDADSIRVLEIAARIRNMFHSRHFRGLDKIIGQKLRILGIRQAGKSDPSLNDIVPSAQKASALLEAQDDIHQDSQNQNVDLYDDMYDDMYSSDAADAVSNVEEHNLATNQQKCNAIADVRFQDEEPPCHRSQSPDSQIRDLKDSYAKIKEELRQKTEAYEERKAYAIKLYNELVEERLSQLTKAFKISKLEEDKETLTQELKEGKEALTKEIPKRAKQYPPLQWSNETSINCGVKAKEQKNDPSASSPSVPRGLKHILSPETVDDLWPKHLEVADDWSAPSLGDVTPTSSKGS